MKAIDKIITSSPINKTAARVVSKGQRYISNKKIINPHWEICPEIKSPNKNNRDLTAIRFGNMVVVGMLANIKNKKSKAKWVCRCDCGCFETRSQKAILNPKNNNDKCHACRNLDEKKRYLEYKYTGKNK